MVFVLATHFFLPNYLNLNTASFFQDWEFDDGSAPPKIVVKDWLKLLKVHLKESPDTCVAVHCVAGLGRLVIMLLYVLNDFAVKKTLENSCLRLCVQYMKLELQPSRSSG